MPRKVAFSAKQKRNQLLEKRAIKRGELPELPRAEVKARKMRQKLGGGRTSRRAKSTVTDAVIRARMLASSFSKLSDEFLEASKEAAAKEPLVRPIPESSRILSPSICEVQDQELTCPRRPEWEYEMTKEEVEKNEEVLFAKWIAQTDEKINSWREANPLPSSYSDSSVLPAPTYYERNIEVWRQFWRVGELSSILMILLDARCPPLHYPPSLDAYIKSLRPARQVILVLTKVDIVGDECASAWKAWLKEKYGENGVQVVGVQSYEQTSYGAGQGSRVKYQPHIPTTLLDELRAALKSAHEALLAPPPEIKEDPEKLSKWKPMVRTHVDWDAIGHHKDGEPATGISETSEVVEREAKPAAAPDEADEDAPSRGYLEDRFLTIGLLGQPNVGKSSLLNALFGEHKVKASRTPGKTKHFQTLFLTPEIRLVDCPGLVSPALVPMELQVLSNIIPIAQIPALPACIRYAGNLMPLEEIFGVDKTMLEVEGIVKDKQTGEGGVRPVKPVSRTEDKGWTALQVMNAYATKRGWKTARTGWPDYMRAGDSMMRSIVEGRVSWAFWPPGSNTPASGLGIWSKGELEHHDEDDVQSSESERDDADSSHGLSSDHGSLVEQDEVEEDEEAEDEPAIHGTIGRFAALGVAGESEDDEDEDVEPPH